MASHVLLVNGGRWTKKHSHPATRLLFCPHETYAASANVPMSISQYSTVNAGVIRFPCRICQRDKNGTGLRVRATLTM